MSRFSDSGEKYDIIIPYKPLFRTENLKKTDKFEIFHDHFYIPVSGTDQPADQAVAAGICPVGRQSVFIQKIEYGPGIVDILVLAIDSSCCSDSIFQMMTGLFRQYLLPKIIILFFRFFPQIMESLTARQHFISRE